MAKRKAPSKEEIVGQPTPSTDFKKFMYPASQTMTASMTVGMEIFELEFLKPNWDAMMDAEIESGALIAKLVKPGMSEEEVQSITILCICERVAKKLLKRVGNVYVKDEKDDFWNNISPEMIGMLGATIKNASSINEMMLKNSTKPARKQATPSSRAVSLEKPTSGTPSSEKSLSETSSGDTVSQELISDK